MATPMIVIAGSVPIRPDARADAVHAALAMARATQAESGCISYRFSADLADPNTFLVFEEWASEEALAAHFTSPHMRTFREQIPRFVAGPPHLFRYAVGDRTVM